MDNVMSIDEKRLTVLTTANALKQGTNNYAQIPANVEAVKDGRAYVGLNIGPATTETHDATISGVVSAMCASAGIATSKPTTSTGGYSMALALGDLEQHFPYGFTDAAGFNIDPSSLVNVDAVCNWTPPVEQVAAPSGLTISAPAPVAQVAPVAAAPVAAAPVTAAPPAQTMTVEVVAQVVAEEQNGPVTVTYGTSEGIKGYRTAAGDIGGNVVHTMKSPATDALCIVKGVSNRIRGLLLTGFSAKDAAGVKVNTKVISATIAAQGNLAAALIRERVVCIDGGIPNAPSDAILAAAAAISAALGFSVKAAAKATTSSATVQVDPALAAAVKAALGV